MHDASNKLGEAFGDWCHRLGVEPLARRFLDPDSAAVESVAVAGAAR